MLQFARLYISACSNIHDLYICFASFSNQIFSCNLAMFILYVHEDHYSIFGRFGYPSHLGSEETFNIITSYKTQLQPLH